MKMKNNTFKRNDFFAKLFVFIFCGFSFFLLFVSPCDVLAERMGIAVDQTSIAFDTDIGEKQEFVITVTNVSDEEQEVVIEPMNYLIGNNNDLDLSSASDEQNGIKDWISLDEQSIILQPKTSEEVVFVFNAPESAPVGSHRGAVVFRSDVKDGGDIAVRGQIAVHVLVNVKGETHASGRVNAFDIPFFTLNEIDYDAEFENTGNIHYVPYGEVIVRNVFTKEEKMYKYEKHFVFPGKKFTFIITDKVPSIFGFYRVQVNFVDGEGVVRFRNDYTMGYLFPVVLFVIIGVLAFFIKWLIGRRKGNDHKRMDYHQKNRVIRSLQKLSDEKRARDIKKEE